MKTLKSAIITLLVLIGLLSTYMVVKYDTSHVLKLSADAYEKKDYEGAFKKLLPLKKKPTPKVYLFEGYLLRGQKQIQASNHAFLTAFQKADSQKLQNEASFNLLLNAYENKDYPFIENHLKKEKQKSAYSHFFKALLSYHHKDYQKAYEHFLEANDKEFYSSWMQREWEEKFPKLFEVSHIAHCLLEIGQIKKGRLLLENHLQEFNEQDAYCSYLLGLSFLKEAPFRIDLLDLSAFQKAQPHLRQLSLWSTQNLPFKRDVLPYYQDLLNQVLVEKDGEALLTTLGLLQDLGLFDEHFTHQLIQELEVEKQKWPKGHFKTFLKQLDTYASSLGFKNELSQYSFQTLDEMIREDQMELLNDLGMALHQTLLEKEQDLSPRIQNHLVTLIENESADLKKAYELFLFWDAIEREETKREAFLHAFLPIVKELWFIDESKALQLSKILDRFSYGTQKGLLQKNMLEILQEISAKAHSPQTREAYLYFNPLITR